MDYLRYLHPIYKDAHRLRQRALVWPSGLVLWIARLPMVRTPLGLRLLTRGLKLLERAIPSSAAVEAFVRAQRPDLMLLTPLVETASKQVDYVKAAQTLGLPSGLCVASWDNLTNKGLIRLVPDAVFVWNGFQKREAVALHDVPPARVVVTGAQLFDEWFDRRPSTTRAQFFGRLGLPADRPMLLYVCSSPLIAEREVPFIRRWIERLRASGPELRRATIVVRPHPQNADQWSNENLDEFDGVAVWPRGAVNRLDQSAKTDFFDSLFHSSAVVGINTSALIEAGIVGRPVFTVLAPEFRQTQDALPQFKHLIEAGGGLLQVAESFEQHLDQLLAALESGSEAASERSRAFVQAFIRPRGLDLACTPVLAEAIEQLGDQPPAMNERPLWCYPLRAALFPAAVIMNRAWGAARRHRLLLATQ
jgi:hypothetical protein